MWYGCVQLLPEKELLACKSITKASILHNVNDLAPAKSALPFCKAAQLFNG